MQRDFRVLIRGYIGICRDCKEILGPLFGLHWGVYWEYMGSYRGSVDFLDDTGIVLRNVPYSVQGLELRQPGRNS